MRTIPKLAVNDIEIKSANKLLREAIINKHGSIEEFSRLAGRSEGTIEKYLNSRKEHNDNFKMKITKLHDIGYENIVIDEKEQICRLTKMIYESIDHYTEGEDILVLEKLLRLCMDNQCIQQIALMHRNLGQYYYSQNKIEQAVEHYKLSINLFENVDDINIKMDCLLGLAIIYIYNKAYDAAKGVLRDAELMIGSGEPIEEHLLFSFYYRSGVLANYLSRYSYAIEMFENARNYAIDDVHMGKAIMNIGIIRKKQKNYSTALDYYNEALSKFTEPYNIAILYNNVAETYRLIGNIEGALNYITKAIDLAPKDDYSNQFIFHQTLIEITSQRGYIYEPVIKLLSLLEQCVDNNSRLFKKFISGNMKGIIEIVVNFKEIELLEKIEKVILKMIQNHKENSIYVDELMICYGTIKYHQAISDKTNIGGVMNNAQ